MPNKTGMEDDFEVFKAQLGGPLVGILIACVLSLFFFLFFTKIGQSSCESGEGVRLPRERG